MPLFIATQLLNETRIKVASKIQNISEGQHLLQLKFVNIDKVFVKFKTYIINITVLIFINPKYILLIT